MRVRRGEPKSSPQRRESGDNSPEGQAGRPAALRGAAPVPGAQRESRGSATSGQLPGLARPAAGTCWGRNSPAASPPLPPASPPQPRALLRAGCAAGTAPSALSAVRAAVGRRGLAGERREYAKGSTPEARIKVTPGEGQELNQVPRG